MTVKDFVAEVVRQFADKPQHWTVEVPNDLLEVGISDPNGSGHNTVSVHVLDEDDTDE